MRAAAKTWVERLAAMGLLVAASGACAGLLAFASPEPPASGGREESLVLVDFALPEAREAVGTAAIGGSLGFPDEGGALRLSAAAPSETALVTISPPTPWDLSPRESVVIRLRNPGPDAAAVRARVEGPEAQGRQDNCRGALVLAPGEEADLAVKLVRRPADPGFAQFAPFYRYARNVNVLDGTIDPSRVARVVVALEGAASGQQVDIQSIRASGRGEAAPVPFLPFVDEFGQYLHAEWPGKIHCEADFAARRAQESADLAQQPGPADWDRFGGWAAGPTLEATGFFHPAKHDGKWWLVDPEGRLFWSYGPTGVGFGGGTPITDREHWFRDLPARDGPFGSCYGSGRGARDRYYREREYETFDFTGANLVRKYGPDYPGPAADMFHRRLRSWGCNTIANWSDPSVYLERKTPYTVAVHYGGPWLDGIPDAFDPRFRETLRERMERERGVTAGDPWCIGYFVDNELWWGYWDDARMVVRGMMKMGPTAAKRAFISDLEERYQTIHALNQSWGADYDSWDALLAPHEGPDVENANVAADYSTFGLEFCERYFSTVREEVKRVAPGNLYLGCRFHGHIDLDLIEIAARHCDVISYNVYDRHPGARLDRYLGVIDKPFIVGEFGVGSDPGQTPFRGDDLSPDPQERPAALAFYLERAFRHDLMVGAHFFQCRDQPITGRSDGEAVLRGFINTADTPHLDLVRASRAAAYDLYGKRARGG